MPRCRQLVLPNRAGHSKVLPRLPCKQMLYRACRSRKVPGLWQAVHSCHAASACTPLLLRYLRHATACNSAKHYHAPATAARWVLSVVGCWPPPRCTAALHGLPRPRTPYAGPTVPTSYFAAHNPTYMVSLFMPHMVTDCLFVCRDLS